MNQLTTCQYFYQLNNKENNYGREKGELKLINAQ